jgi:peptide-methionine (R)-S-oxide reductase
MSKRSFIGSAAAAVGVALSGRSSRPSAEPETFEINRSDEEWRSILTPEQYAVLRNAHTERPRSSPLDHEHRTGTFLCAGCDLPIYASTAKFDSRTGWPSFTAPIADSVRFRDDRGFLGTRTEVHCRRCGGHLGHVFDDGPPPTGQRYCMNGIAMKFAPA